MRLQDWIGLAALVIAVVALVLELRGSFRG